MELQTKRSSKPTTPFHRDNRGGRRLVDLTAGLEDLEVKVFLLEERIDGLELAHLDVRRPPVDKREVRGPG